MRTLLVVCAAIGVASCSMAREDICSTVPPVEDDIGNPGEFAQNLQDPAWVRRRAENCVHRWGYRLAGSKDDGLVVAKAVMQACEGAVNEHAAGFAKRVAADIYGDQPDTAASRRARIDIVEESRTATLDRLEREAHFRVQQARAGNCKAPK